MGKGQAVELKARALDRPRRRGPASTIRCRRRSTRWRPCARSGICARAPTPSARCSACATRSACAIHKFFQERGFLYVHTPVISASDAEGAGSMFRVTTLDLERSAKRQAADFAQDFFGKRTYLTVSGQLEAEIFALAFANVYTFGPTFRAENSNTPRHLAEFWMIEPEMAFCDLEGQSGSGRRISQEPGGARARRTAGADLEFLRQVVRPRAAQDAGARLLNASFERITYTEAIALLRNPAATWEFPAHWGADLQSEHERYLTEEVFKKPVIVTDYPKEIKAFYMRGNDDGKTVAAMDVLAPRIGEIIGGSQREERHDVLLEKIRAHGRSRPERRGLLVVSGSAPLRRRPARRLRPGLRAHDDVPDRHEEHPRRDSLPPHPGNAEF